MIKSKASLAVALSKLKTYSKPSISLEQYPTDSEIAAEILWSAYMHGDLSGKTVADLGSGTGILGIGALYLGASKVFFVEKDSKAMAIAKENIEFVEVDETDVTLVTKPIEEFKTNVDLIIMNPPFGTKEEHADKAFLEAAFNLSNVVYSFHKSTTKTFVHAISKDHNFKVSREFNFNFPIKKAHEFHKKKIKYIKVSCFRLEKESFA